MQPVPREAPLQLHPRPRRRAVFQRGAPLRGNEGSPSTGERRLISRGFDLFDRLVKLDPEAVALELLQWPITNSLVSYQYAAMSCEVVPASKVATLPSEIMIKSSGIRIANRSFS